MDDRTKTIASTRNAFDWSRLEHFRICGADIRQGGYNALILKLLRRLHAAPERTVHLVDCEVLRGHRPIVDSFWNFLSQLGAVTGSLEAARLTELGRNALDHCLEELPDIALAFRSDHHGPMEPYASQLVLAVYRHALAARA